MNGGQAGAVQSRGPMAGLNDVQVMCVDAREWRLGCPLND